MAAGLPRFNKPRGAQVPLYSARVLVSLRPSVLDPAGEATRAAASRLGVDGVSKLRIGKAVEVELEAPNPQAAREQLWNAIVDGQSPEICSAISSDAGAGTKREREEASWKRAIDRVNARVAMAMPAPGAEG